MLVQRKDVPPSVIAVRPAFVSPLADCHLGHPSIACREGAEPAVPLSSNPATFNRPRQSDNGPVPCGPVPHPLPVAVIEVGNANAALDVRIEQAYQDEVVHILLELPEPVEPALQSRVTRTKIVPVDMRGWRYCKKTR